MSDCIGFSYVRTCASLISVPPTAGIQTFQDEVFQPCVFPYKWRVSWCDFPPISFPATLYVQFRGAALADENYAKGVYIALTISGNLEFKKMDPLLAHIPAYAVMFISCGWNSTVFVKTHIDLSIFLQLTWTYYLIQWNRVFRTWCFILWVSLILRIVFT